jgi:hypothetical protein
MPLAHKAGGIGADSPVPTIGGSRPNKKRGCNQYNLLPELTYQPGDEEKKRVTFIALYSPLMQR